MRPRDSLIALLALALAGGPAGRAPRPPRTKDAFIPLLVYRTGPYAPSGIPIANGFVDYFTLLNERDGGINGVKVAFEECETQYDTKQGVECYERLKGKGALLVNPVQHRHHLPAHSQGPRRQDRRVLDGLRHERRRPTAAGSRGCSTSRPTTGARPRPSSATSAARRAGSTSSRARRSPTSSTTAPTARKPTRRWRTWRKQVPVRADAAGRRSSRARSRSRRGCRCAG